MHQEKLVLPILFAQSRVPTIKGNVRLHHQYHRRRRLAISICLLLSMLSIYPAYASRSYEPIKLYSEQEEARYYAGTYQQQYGSSWFYLFSDQTYIFTRFTPGDQSSINIHSKGNWSYRPNHIDITPDDAQCEWQEKLPEEWRWLHILGIGDTSLSATDNAYYTFDRTEQFESVADENKRKTNLIQKFSAQCSLP